MNNTYIIYEKTLKDVLDEVETSVRDLNKFQSKHVGYEYEVSIRRLNNTRHKLWRAEIKVKYEKQENNQRLKGAVEPPKLL